MKIALLAEHVLKSARLKLSRKAKSTKSIRNFAPIAVHVSMYVPLTLYIQNSYAIIRNGQGCSKDSPVFIQILLFYSTVDYILPSQEVLVYQC